MKVPVTASARRIVFLLTECLYKRRLSAPTACLAAILVGAFLLPHDGYSQEKKYVTDFLVPITLIQEVKIPISGAGQYYTYGYESLMGRVFIRPSSRGVEMYPDKAEIQTHLMLEFSYLSPAIVYDEYGKQVAHLAANIDMGLHVSLSITADVYWNGNSLGTHSWHFGKPYGQCESAGSVINIPSALWHKYHAKKSDLNSIAATGAADAMKALDAMTFNNLQVVKLKQGVPAIVSEEAKKIYQAALAAEREKKEKAVAGKKAAEEKAKQDEAMLAKKDPGQQSTASSSSDDDYWNERPRAATTNSGPDLPVVGIGPDGKYYRKESNGKYTEIGYDEYQSIRAKRAARHQQNTTPEKSNDELIAETKQKLQQQNDDYWASLQESHRKIEEQTALIGRSFYANQAVTESKENLKNLTRLNGNYATVEELEADFNSRYYSVNQEVENLNQARNDAARANADMLKYNSDETTRAIGETAVMVGALLNDARAEKEKKEARDALERQRQQKLMEIEARRKALTIEMRKGLLAQFPDGGVPLSSYKVNTSELYYFAYIMDPYSINQDHAVAHVSNVFPVSQYGDGTWPFKAGIVTDLKKLSTGTVTLMGYYTTQALAEQMRASFLKLARKCNITVKEIAYQGKKSSGVKDNGDFWENGAKKPGQEKKSTTKKDDFWDN